ncbi:MAG: family 20 glycosylhydrolase [Thomasclavelia sp.]
MKKILKIVLALALAFSGIVVGQINNVYASNENISAYPHVQSYQTTTGTFFLARESRIFIVENEKTIDNQALLDDVELLSSQLGTLLDKSPNIVIGDKANVLENDIVIQLEELEELASHNQSYRIDIDDHITITAKDNIGIFYGVQTLIQLLKINDYTLLQGTILDWPDTNERSMHLDLARKYFSIDWIKDLIEEMSYLKMNSLQIHFSEHEGYRLESNVLNNVEGFNYPSQYYTKEQMAEIVQYANKYHIDVIPSLDSPGHMRYVLNYLPNEYRLSSVSNLASDGAASGTFNIFNEEAKDFLKSLFTEYAEFFSELGCTKMNIGGDEFLNNFSLLTEEQYSGVMNYFNEITAILKEY